MTISTATNNNLDIEADVSESMRNMDNLRMQHEEFLAIQSILCDHEDLCWEEKMMQKVQEYLNLDFITSVPTLQYSIHFKSHTSHGEIPSLDIQYPPEYPEECLQFAVHCPSMPRSCVEKLRRDLSHIAENSQGNVVAFAMYQKMDEAIRESNRVYREDDAKKSSLSVVDLDTYGTDPVVLGRRAIYFHHIIAASKRSAILDWARELELSGYSKIGWPGIVIAEGDERHLRDFVRRLQLLRWKQMSVRGEQQENATKILGDVLTDSDDRCSACKQSTHGTCRKSTINAMRRFSHGFQELPRDALSELGKHCTAVGLKDLFLTTLKIHSRSVDADEANAASRTKR